MGAGVFARIDAHTKMAFFMPGDFMKRENKMQPITKYMENYIDRLEELMNEKKDEKPVKNNKEKTNEAT